jgi:hypothetical protein
MKRSLLFPLLLATTLAFQATALAQQTKVPSLINYQGYVTSSAGVPIGAGAAQNRTVTFRFWKSATDTAAASRLFSESQTVTILDGDFSVLIGNGAAVEKELRAVATVAEVFAYKEVFLGITVDDGSPATTDAEISPRQQLVSTAFAFRASVAESVDNGAISNAMIDLNAVNTDQLAASSVTSAKIADSSITSADIADGTISRGDLGTNSVYADEIAAGAVRTDEIFNLAVTHDKLAANAVYTGNILDGTITAADIAGDTITTANIKDGTITAADIAGNTITTANIKDGTITSADLGTGSVSAAEIAANAVGNSELADNSVSSNKLGNNTIRAEESLRIIRGTVYKNGGIIAGSGFRVNRLKTGLYQIIFTTAFPDFPSVTATRHGRWGTAITVFELENDFPFNGNVDSIPTRNGFNVGILDPTAVTSYNQSFSFIAIGPR